MNDCWIGFDLGGTKMLAIAYDAEFRPLGRKRRKTRGHEGMQTGVERIVQTIRDAMKEAKIDDGRLAGIGVGCPGPLDLDQGVILDAPNLGWSNVPLARLLGEEFGCPTVIANDVDAGVYGESRFGAAKSAHCVLGIFPGTGIGGGCVYEGRIIRGARSSCMEIGHIQVVPNGPRCGCGLRGCLEAVASRLAIAAAVAQAAYRGQAPRLRELAGTDLSHVRSGVLAAAVAAGDEVVADILREAGRHMGVAAAAAIHLFSPDTVVLGGGLVEALPNLFVEAVGESARNNVMATFRDSFRVVAAKLGDDATALGAAAWARELIEHPAIPADQPSG